jgi:hypothetical protein
VSKIQTKYSRTKSSELVDFIAHSRQTELMMDNSSLTLKQLDRELALLRKLAQNLDPFAPIGKKEIRELKKAGIEAGLDPFAITNQLLKKLEDGLELRMELEKREQLH